MAPNDFKPRYERDGYYFPLTAFGADQATKYGRRVQEIANSNHACRLGNRGQINQLHVLCPFVNEIIRNPAILDAVESVLGPNLLVWGTSVFLKPPHSSGFVSWHQDLTYWGLNNEQEMSAWVAFGSVNQENGCMHFLPGSHNLGQKPHRDVVDASNILTRGQHAEVDVDESQTIPVELEPGQVSLHHGHLLHRSGPNNTDHHRVGMVINYISTSVYQSVADLDFAMLVRGVDEHHHFEELPVPKAEFDEDGFAMHDRMMAAHNNVLYDGARNMDSAAPVSRK